MNKASFPSSRDITVQIQGGLISGKFLSSRLFAAIKTPQYNLYFLPCSLVKVNPGEQSEQRLLDNIAPNA